MKYSKQTASGETIENLPYATEPISKTIANLPTEYSEVYQYTFNNKVLLGWWSGDWDNTTMYVEFDYRVGPAAKTNSYNLRDLIFYNSSLDFEMYGTSALTDVYNLNDGKKIGGVASNIFSVQAQSNFNIGTAIQIDGEGNKWYSYNPNDAVNTTSVFTEGATANVKVTISNNTGASVKEAYVYIPIPKQGQTVLGEHFISQAEFDMFVADVANCTEAENWTVQYGEVTEVQSNNNGVPTGEFTLNGDWSNDYEDIADANMIKLALSTPMKDGASAEIILKFKATTDTDQTDGLNIFKSWYSYTTEKATLTDANKVYNFGALLQNGILNGIVYFDTDRNSTKGNDEEGVPNVVVRVTDETGKTYEKKTQEDGTYSFDSLPGDKAMTVTVVNPQSPDPNAHGGSYRFSQTNTGSGESIGSDVTPADDNRSASKSDVKLSESSGAATVNAGLITPYTIQFSAGDHGNVSPASIKAYEGQTLGDVLNQTPTVTSTSGWQFSGQWTCGTTTVAHDALLSQQVSGDATYTAQLAAVPSGTITGTTSITLKTPVDNSTNSTILTVSLDDQSSLSGLTYQWQKLGSDNQWTNIENATTASLNLSALTMADNGTRYQCIVKNDWPCHPLRPERRSGPAQRELHPAQHHRRRRLYQRPYHHDAVQDR